MYCNYCGAQYEEGHKFCSQCGHQLLVVNNSQSTKVEENMQRSPLPQGQTIAKSTLNVLEAAKLAIFRLDEFSGRSRRSEYWWWMFITSVPTLIALLILISKESTSTMGNYILITHLVLTSSIIIRRLHDTNKPEFIGYIYIVSACLFNIVLLIRAIGQNSYSSLCGEIYYGMHDLLEEIHHITFVVTLIFGLIVLVFSVFDSTKEQNQYGKSPKYV